MTRQARRRARGVVGSFVLMSSACAHTTSPSAPPVALVWIRVKGISIEAAFPGLTISEFRRAYRSFYAETRRGLEERWQRKPAGTVLPHAALHDAVQQIVIYWFYVYNINKREVRITEWELSHPATRRIVQRVIAKTFPQDTPEHTATCAALLGMTEHQFLEWEHADKRMMEAL